MRAPSLREQFEDLDKQAHAARLGMWAFLGSELLLFAGLFTLYAALFPALVLLTAKLALDTESRLTYLLWILLGTLLLHLALRFTDRLAQQGIIGGFPEDETDQGPQTLGLFQ